MRQIVLRGMGVALITPFKCDGTVDYPALSYLVDYQLQNGIDYLIVLGTTAETPTLSYEEQKEIVRLVVSIVRERIPIVVGVGGNNTQAVIHKLNTEDFGKIDAILSVVPYYNKPTQDGIYQHFKYIAQATSLPIILYNVPSRTGVNMTAETSLLLANDFENIVAIKEASGNIDQIGVIIENKPSGFQVLSGDDELSLSLIGIGAVGVISVIGNVFPKEFGKMIRLALNGDSDNARIIHGQFAELFELLFIEGNPAGVKGMLNVMGFIENKLRLPLVPVLEATYERIKKALLMFRTQ
ncbi:4-hydroxy-tetrahydrodipicolinate synthase [Candidatus Azobacteroides pseudotrichonymphae]|uniref:4-hydroxy-tetrahydrodipicolinate synthase n=1 Tax=Azobacteroides pseudotrichonymphae genomovar. CFP2 TaxID=511995 RepID=DAPA_AZOPC|nr:4-hydroxy-tetrahydrodipicolinate synthase [Candidatus Azobacteroides pseudotrichonymphae]B6YQ20.1 RecName: Full=4-hydroxy-tetrahydrodipicolinate synthase; Short=HTPA synthase [Candidatus Azobacteroides pseudotrichonymphae genomovar. CFP2]BAG83292.1 dihydrodipicolinate synthase [Candidatus Azobacteroides pseudotrichonymphae genomovar. CFP2]